MSEDDPEPDFACAKTLPPPPIRYRCAGCGDDADSPEGWELLAGTHGSVWLCPECRA